MTPSVKEKLKLIGEHLILLRNLRRKSLEQVASDLDMSPNLLFEIEEGLYDVSMAELLRLSEYYMLKPSDFLREE